MRPVGTPARLPARVLGTDGGSTEGTHTKR